MEMCKNNNYIIVNEMYLKFGIGDQVAFKVWTSRKMIEHDLTY
jgi:hypothetical protein